MWCGQQPPWLTAMPAVMLMQLRWVSTHAWTWGALGLRVGAVHSSMVPPWCNTTEGVACIDGKELLSLDVRHARQPAAVVDRRTRLIRCSQGLRP